MASELDALQQSIAAVLQDVCGRRAVHDFIDGKSDLDTRLWARAAELGWLGCAIPEADGGLGLGAAGLDLLNRELGKYLAPGPFIPTLAAAQWLSREGDARQKDRYLAAIVAGEATVAMPLILGATGTGGTLRMWGAAGATLAILPGADGSTLRLVELAPNEGRLTPVAGWDRTRQLLDLSVEDLEAGAVIGGPERLVSSLCLAIASDSLGAARSIADQTVEYLNTREQFGRPLGSFQALKHRAADLYSRLAIQEQVQFQAIDALAEDSDADMWSLLAKAGATDAAAFITADCVQLHGGVGHTWEFDPHMFLKRARLNQALVTPNRAALDTATDLLKAAARAGRSTAELAL